MGSKGDAWIIKLKFGLEDVYIIKIMGIRNLWVVLII